MQASLLIILALASSSGRPPAQGEGQTPPPPKRVHYVEPQFPAAARQVSPPLQGIVILEMTLNEEGRPVDIKVLRPMPLLDRAAVDAAKQWRYAATMVDGVPASVVVQEVVDMFPDHEAGAKYWADMLSKTKEALKNRLDITMSADRWCSSNPDGACAFGAVPRASRHPRP